MPGAATLALLTLAGVLAAPLVLFAGPSFQGEAPLPPCPVPPEHDVGLPPHEEDLLWVDDLEVGQVLAVGTPCGWNECYFEKTPTIAARPGQSGGERVWRIAASSWTTWSAEGRLHRNYIHRLHRWQNMAFRTISLAEDAYDSLAALRGPGESFTDVVRRLTRRPSLRDLSGTMSKKNVEALAKAMAASKRERIQRRREQLEGLR